MANWLNRLFLPEMAKSSSTKKTPGPHVSSSPPLIGSGTVDGWSNESLEDSCHRGASQILLHKKLHTASWATLQWLHPVLDMNCTIIPPPLIFHVCGLYGDRHRVLGACIMYLFFPCAVLLSTGRLRKLQVVNRLISPWPDLTAHLMLTWGSESERTTAARNAEEWPNAGQAARLSVCLSVCVTAG